MCGSTLDHKYIINLRLFESYPMKKKKVKKITYRKYVSDNLKTIIKLILNCRFKHFGEMKTKIT